MIILRKYWSRLYKKIAIGARIKNYYFVVIISTDGVVVRQNVLRNRNGAESE